MPRDRTKRTQERNSYLPPRKRMAFLNADAPALALPASPAPLPERDVRPPVTGDVSRALSAT